MKPAALPPCPRDIAGADPLLRPGATVVLGEVHGTVESPRFAGDLACHAARRGPVLVALEIPRNEQPRLETYLASAGSPGDRAILFGSMFWSRSDQDGRSSDAMLALLDTVRAERAAGVDVPLLAFDIEEAAPRDQRDRAMANALLEARPPTPGRPSSSSPATCTVVASRAARGTPTSSR